MIRRRRQAQHFGAVAPALQVLVEQHAGTLSINVNNSVPLGRAIVIDEVPDGHSALDEAHCPGLSAKRVLRVVADKQKKALQ